MTSSAPRASAPAFRGAVWAVVAVLFTGALGALRLFGDRRFYFADDSQVGAFGQWWQLGGELLDGRIPVLDPQAWQAGNYFAEGQWGLINPLTWIVAIAAHLSEDAAMHGAVVKIAFLMLMAGGVYLLGRSFGASAPWAALAASLVPLSGFTVYMDAPSWATGLFNAAVLPWAWWGLRRLVENRRSPWWYLASSYLLITFGYIFGVLVLVVILVESLVRACLARDRARIIRTVAASAWGALLTVAVYLPGVLTAPVTERAGFQILNNWFLSADLSDLASAGAPVATASVGAWWGPATNAPLVYIAWILPFVPLFFPLARDAVRRCIPLFVVAALTLLVVIGPSNVGPLRWPVRFMPYLALALIVLVAVMATRAFPDRISWRGAAWSLGVLAVTTGLTYANTPGGWKGIGAAALIQLVALSALVIVARSVRIPWTSTRRSAVAVAGALGITALLVVPQMVIFPTTPLPKFAVPDSVSRMNAVLEDAPGDAIVVGDVYARSGTEASFDERLIANLWYLSPSHVSSLYTVLPYSTFSRELCTDLRGSTCDEALETLWSVDPTTDLTVADLMGVSTIVAMKETFPRMPAPPDGWRIAEEGTYTWLLERTAPVPVAGGVVWTGEGTDVSVIEQSDTSVTLTVDSVGPEGSVVLSRLDYPGYRVDGADLVDPLRGWLLTVDVSDASAGDTVTVSFRPPGFALMIGSFAGAALLVAGWIVVLVRSRPRLSGGSVDRTAGPGTRD